MCILLAWETISDNTHYESTNVLSQNKLQQIMENPYNTQKILASNT